MYLDNPQARIRIERHIGLFSNYTEAKTVDYTGGHWPGLVDDLTNLGGGGSGFGTLSDIPVVRSSLPHILC